jgi:hypothetical protein
MFRFHSVQVHSVLVDGKRHTRKNTVSVNGSKGIKKVEVNGTKKRKNTKKLTRKEISNIKKGKFMPGFFNGL